MLNLGPQGKEIYYLILQKKERQRERSLSQYRKWCKTKDEEKEQQKEKEAKKKDEMVTDYNSPKSMLKSFFR